MVSSVVSGAGMVKQVSTNKVSQNSGVSKSSDFKSVMAASLAQNTSAANSGVKNNNQGVTGAAKNDAQPVQKNNSTSKADDKNVDDKKVDDRQNKPVNSKKDDNELNDKLSELTENVKNIIKEELDVSDEDIAEAMELLGMTVNDLLSVVKVTELVGELTGTDAITLITDDNMLNKLTAVLDVVNSSQQDIADMLGVNTDEIGSVISEVQIEPKAANTQTTTAKDNADKQSVPEDNTQVTVKETTSDILAAKITTDNQDRQQSSSDSQNHNTQSYGNVADNLLQSISESYADVITEDVSYVSEADIVNQVIDQVKLTAGKELTSIEVMLNPERLGSVHVTVTAKNGILSAQIAAQNEQVKTALENQMTALKENFNNQGIKVEAVEITVMAHQFEAGQNFGQGESERRQSEHKVNKKLDLSAFDEEADEEAGEDDLRRHASIQNGNSSVEYTA